MILAIKHKVAKANLCTPRRLPTNKIAMLSFLYQSVNPKFNVDFAMNSHSTWNRIW